MASSFTRRFRLGIRENSFPERMVSFCSGGGISIPGGAKKCADVILWAGFIGGLGRAGQWLDSLILRTFP